MKKQKERIKELEEEKKVKIKEEEAKQDQKSSYIITKPKTREERTLVRVLEEQALTLNSRINHLKQENKQWKESLLKQTGLNKENCLTVFNVDYFTMILDDYQSKNEKKIKKIQAYNERLDAQLELMKQEKSQMKEKIMIDQNDLQRIEKENKELFRQLNRSKQE